ncbi:TetR/AcrR family transcriptional regulator [Paenibacillus terrigena]|uniref:TetR/AcrR family transcriptional regulator n=1 Tax=Paenibacillus terrigena TaxID=369333 RepID=UPI0028D1AA70|nr:TetR/AcrR family transcriptional regulator [Paenibacillus terrigena]
MEEHMPEKKKQIMLSAMKLFATKGFSHTTMQEVASFCKMSKGSVYQYYSSKDELLLNIFMYQSKLLEDRMQMIERAGNLDPRERLIRKIEVYLSIWNEHPEFIKMQMRDNADHVHKDIRDFMFNMSKQSIEMLVESLRDLYGQEFEHYLMDGASLLSSLVFTYMCLKLFDNIPIQIEKISEYIIDIMDYTAEGMMKHRPSPLLDVRMFSFLERDEAKTKIVHPLVLVKQMREAVETTSIAMTNEQDVMDSILVLEEELLQVQPRKVILLGMLSNIKEVAVLSALYEQLCLAMDSTFRYPPGTFR